MLTVLVISLPKTVPVRVAINRNLCIAQTLQPLVPIVASVPATALFPILLLALTQVRGSLKIGFIVLIVLGTMLYVLFNVTTALSILSKSRSNTKDSKFGCNNFSSYRIGKFPLTVSHDYINVFDSSIY